MGHHNHSAGMLCDYAWTNWQTLSAGRIKVGHCGVPMCLHMTHCLVNAVCLFMYSKCCFDALRLEYLDLGVVQYKFS